MGTPPIHRKRPAATTPLGSNLVEASKKPPDFNAHEKYKHYKPKPGIISALWSKKCPQGENDPQYSRQLLESPGSFLQKIRQDISPHRACIPAKLKVGKDLGWKVVSEFGEYETALHLRHMDLRWKRSLESGTAGVPVTWEEVLQEKQGDGDGIYRIAVLVSDQVLRMGNKGKSGEAARAFLQEFSRVSARWLDGFSKDAQIQLHMTDSLKRCIQVLLELTNLSLKAQGQTPYRMPSTATPTRPIG